ncbi:hypothetical protein T07_1035 [Trichinella nelsoni]|uniref:Uncharacterized protein n=1 Tax=Trichinella nelsoni TaxID=6336 RepID=A0A0V0RUF5_9BILA|nr:hypothetical protein T07_1035 [Trichinella nelsoni]
MSSVSYWSKKELLKKGALNLSTAYFNTLGIRTSVTLFNGKDSRKVASVTELGSEIEVQDSEAVERKCICGDYWKIVSVNQIDLFVGLTRECEDWQKINGRLVVRKQAQKAKMTNDIKIYLEFRHESQSNKLKVYENLQANDVRRMNNGVFNAMMDEEEQ